MVYGTNGKYGGWGNEESAIPEVVEAVGIAL
jgi:hypothetical protein